MIEGLPQWINILFVATCVITLVLFYYSNNKPKRLTIALVLWSIIHSVLAYSGFYENALATPPRFAFVLIPSIVLIIYGLLPRQQVWFLKSRITKISTFLHSVRLPVEIVLYGLFINKMVPELMTFEGRNYDILIGITAPIIGILFLKEILGKRSLLIWNVIGLILVLFIFINGIFSSELPFQQFGFDQPNRAIIYFPFILLPATVVPIVIWTHLSDIIKLRKELRDDMNHSA